MEMNGSGCVLLAKCRKYAFKHIKISDKKICNIPNKLVIFVQLTQL